MRPFGRAKVRGGTIPSFVTSDIPYWVPTGAKIFIDFIGARLPRAWADGIGEVAVSTLLGNDPNVDSAWGLTSVYDPANLTADGYASDSSPLIAFIGAARTKLLDSATTVCRYKQVDTMTDNSTNTLALLNAAGSQGLELDLNCNTDVAPSFIGSSYGGSASLANNAITNIGVGALNVVAATVTATRLEVSANGCTVMSATLLDADRPAASPLVDAFVSIAHKTALQTITIYDALPSTVGLSALSSTGVTNTAPTAITINWTDNIPAGSFSQAASNTGGPAMSAANPTATDAEGNPAIWSIVSDDTGKLAFSESTPLNQLNYASSVELTPGDYHFTLRATDPGGLHFDQQFTITVTA